MNEFFDSTDSIGLEKNKTTYYLTNQVFDNIHAFVFIFDFKRKIPIWINKYYETRMGYSLKDLENLTSKKFFSLFQPDSLKVFENKMKNYNSLTDTDRKTIYKLKTYEGNWINMMISTSILNFDEDGKARYLLGYGIEIIDDELHKSLNKLFEIEHKSTNFVKFNKLSKRELEILVFIANSYTDKEIADKLNISINTSKTHRKRIISKLGLKNTASLVKLAIECNLA